MNSILEKVNLLHRIDFNFNISQETFYQRLSEKVDKGSISLLSEGLEPFKKSKNLYLGKVEFSSFVVKRRKKMYSFYSYIPIASGEIKSDGNSILVKVVIRGMRHLMYYLTILLIIIYLLFLLLCIVLTFSSSEFELIMFPILFTHALFSLSCIYGFHYFATKSLICNLSNDLKNWMK